MDAIAGVRADDTLDRMSSAAELHGAHASHRGAHRSGVGPAATQSTFHTL